MHDHSHASVVPAAQDGKRSLILLGNPNVGKSVTFGFLTGTYANVSNYPGTTVEITAGTHRASGRQVLDSPGANSLIPASDDERVARDIVLEALFAGSADILQVADAKNLRRGLLITLQLAELEAPAALVANMLDEARAHGLYIDFAKLGALAGTTALGAVATRKEGLERLAADDLSFKVPTLAAAYDPAIEAAAAKAAALMPAETPGKRGLALMFLSGDASFAPWAERVFGARLADAEAVRAGLAAALRKPVAYAINEARLAAADKIVAACVKHDPRAVPKWASRLGDLAMHPVWGIGVAAAVLFVCYLFIGKFGAGTAVDFLENTIFAEYLVPWADAALRAVLPAAWQPFLVGEAGVEIGTGPGLLIGDYGAISMALSYSIAIIFPIVTFFFIAFSIMEDSGYLPRLAIVLDRVFKLMGLNGKAVLPMILGLGCDTMATMTARIMPTRKERIIVTLLLALAVPCSAQLGVILAMLAGLSFWATLVWLGAVAFSMLLVGFLANRALPGYGGDFIMEIPPIRRPALLNVAVKTLSRVEWYLKEAVPLFIVGTLLLWVLDRLNVLAAVQGFAEPLVVHLLGLPAQASDAFLVGFLRRDYGAAGLYSLFAAQLESGTAGVETQIQVVVAMVTITLFIPCIANFFMIIKEQGLKTALYISAFIIPFAFGAGTALNFLLRGVLL